MTVLSFLGYEAKSFAHLHLKIFCHSQQILSSFVILDGDSQWTTGFRSLHSYLVGFRFRPGLGNSRTLTESLSHSCIVRLYALGHCPFGRWTFGPDWGSEQLFIKNISVLCSVQLSLDPDLCPGPYPCKTSPQHNTINTMLHRWDGFV